MQALRVIDGSEERAVLALELPDGTTFGEWLTIGRRLRLGSQALNWHIGDWWKFGVSHWGEEETRKSAVEIWGVEGETARVYGWVATKFDPVNRLTDLSFTHYQRAASLPIDEAKRVIEKASAEGLSVRDVQREVQSLKAANDPERVRADEQPAPSPSPRTMPPQSARAELTTAYEIVIEFAEALQQLRPLSRRETDLLALAETFVDEARAGHRQCPDDFEIIFVEKGRLACEEHYGASRLTVNRWLIQRGKSRLINKRADFVRFQRDQQHPAPPERVREDLPFDEVMFALAREAANFLRINRYGGWTITATADHHWLVGTVRKTSDELLAMAERQGFDSEAARTELDAE